MQDEAQITSNPISPVSVRMIAATGAVLMTSGAAFVAYFDPEKSSLLPVCPIFTLTGFACPGCGLTRAFHSLFHGDIVSAIDFNALVSFWTVIFGYLFVSLVLLAVRGRGLPMRLARPGFLVLILIGLIGFGVVRNIPIYPFTILFP